MKKKLIFIPIFFVAIAALVIWGLMALWNALVPEIFGWSSITYWQAAGLLLLSKILFGGFHGGGKHRCNGQRGYDNGGWKHKFKHKWAKMSEEDKKRWESKFAGLTGRDGCSKETENSELNSTKTEETN